MPATHDPDAVLACSTCDETAPRPKTGRYGDLWDDGWRWRGAFTGPVRLAPDGFTVSCPNCPPAI